MVCVRLSLVICWLDFMGGNQTSYQAFCRQTVPVSEI